MQSGLVTNIQRYSIQDGPGIRTTVFLKGCPLACWWCHNPEGRSKESEIVVQETRCVRCGACITVCRSGGPIPAEEAPRKGSEECTLCGACVEACPTGARQMTGRLWTVDEVVEEVRRDSIFYDDSGGGVTFSGGEPLMQSEFLASLLQACRARGFHCAVDTCGHVSREILLSLARQVDLFLYDLKMMDETRHIEFTGVSNARILENLRELGSVHGNIWLRIPIIPGLNDREEQLDAMASLAASIPGIRQVNLLPYHRTGMPKFMRLGQAYRLGHILPPEPAQMEAAVTRFRALGLKAKSGG